MALSWAQLHQLYGIEGRGQEGDGAESSRGGEEDKFMP